MSDIQFERVPQNDLVALRYVKEDYETEPARGLTHGLQKDAIQNSLGAAKSFKSLKGWKISFEITEINKKDALIFTDEGTCGLTGKILTPKEIVEQSSKGDLGPDERLSRFLSLFESGGNTGPGSYGRGKLVFQACSKTSTILCDSLREDGKYIAFKRTIVNNQLVQSKVFEDAEAKKFISEETGKKLPALDKEGTRVIILDLLDTKQVDGRSIKNSFLKSFEDNSKGSFLEMIQESWWEILLKYNATIILKAGNKQKNVNLNTNLKRIFTIRDQQNGFRVYERENLKIQLYGSNYRLKRLRFVLVPKNINDIPNSFFQISSQRKRMRIGKINKNIEPDNKIKNRFVGIVESDNGLEDLLVEPENLTHYGYKNFNNGALKEIRQVIKKHLDDFQINLGIIKRSDDDVIEKEIRDALKDINEQAKNIGLVTNFGSGTKDNSLSIKLNSFTLPNDSSLRVEYNDYIGSIEYTLNNESSKNYEGKFRVSVEQRGLKHKQLILEKDIEILSGENRKIAIPKFKIDTDFRYQEGVMIRAELVDQRVYNTKMLWLGIEKPYKPEDYPFKLKISSIQFPRENTKRVEIGESIKDLKFIATNDTNENIKCNIILTIRRGFEDKKELKVIYNEIKTVNALEDLEIKIDEINIDRSNFGFLENEQEIHELRMCELYLRISSQEYYPELEISRSDMLIPRKKIPFWLGLDDPGQSIFNQILVETREKDPRKSWFSGNSGTGFNFHLNQSHIRYKHLDHYADTNELRYEYYKEEMIKQALFVCIHTENFSGIFEEMTNSGDITYEAVFNQQDFTFDHLTIFEELFSKVISSI